MVPWGGGGGGGVAFEIMFFLPCTSYSRSDSFAAKLKMFTRTMTIEVYKEDQV